MTQVVEQPNDENAYLVVGEGEQRARYVEKEVPIPLAGVVLDTGKGNATPISLLCSSFLQAPREMFAS